MRFVSLSLLILISAGCAARSINSNLARAKIMDIPQADLEKEDVDVAKVIQTSGTEAMAETRLKTAFRIEKVKGEWIVREVRIGHGQWEKISNLTAVLDAVKIAETKKMLGQISEAVQKYRQDSGSLPVFKDYIALSDQLSPKYLTPLIRLDAWRNPFGAEGSGTDTIVVQSSGPDGKFGTNDDIRMTVSR